MTRAVPHDRHPLTDEREPPPACERCRRFPLPRSLQESDKGKETVPLRVGERGGGLVEENDPWLRRENAGNLGELLLSHVQPADFRLRVDGEPRSARLFSASRYIARQSMPPSRDLCGFPRKMFSATLRAGTRLSSWYTMPMPNPRAVLGAEIVHRLPEDD